MKTWTNPTVEELDVKLTASGFAPSWWETREEFEAWLLQNPEHKNEYADADWDIFNDNFKDKTQS
mgnify:CR=1 FL=1